MRKHGVVSPGVRGRTLLAISVAAMLALGIAACGGDSDDSGSSGDEFTVGYAAPFLTDPFQAVLQDQTVTNAEDAGLEVLPPTNANADPGKQLTDMRNLISSGATGMIVVPNDSKAVVPGLEQAAEDDVQVVSIDLGPEGGEVAMIVRADNYGMGETACEHMGKELNGEGKVLSLQGDLATINGADRTDGFRDCMEEKYPDIELLEEPTDWDPKKATDAAQTVVTANPDIAGIYMQSDSVMLSGVLNILKQAGLDAKVGEPDHVVLVSIDGTSQALDAIRSDELDALVSQPLDLYAKYGVQYLQDAVAGETFEPGKTDHDSKIVDFEGNPMDLLPAPLVTKENVDDQNLWGNQASDVETEK
jgi:ribose transport system substrate-binding protein